MAIRDLICKLIYWSSCHSQFFNSWFYKWLEQIVCIGQSADMQIRLLNDGLSCLLYVQKIMNQEVCFFIQHLIGFLLKITDGDNCFMYDTNKIGILRNILQDEQDGQILLFWANLNKRNPFFKAVGIKPYWYYESWWPRNWM